MIIYMATNKTNGKKYIGQTVRGLQKRQREHESSARGDGDNFFHNAIRKHGAENFTWEVICFADDIGAMNILEEYFIAKYGTLDSEKGYNLRSGGENSKLAESTKEKIGAAVKGRKHTEETRKKIGEAGKGRKCKPFTEETKKRMGEGKKGKKNHQFGKPLTEETKKKLSEARRDRTIHKFQHENHGIITCTQYYLRAQYGFHKGSLSKLVNGKLKSLKGWTLA